MNNLCGGAEVSPPHANPTRIQALVLRHVRRTIERGYSGSAIDMPDAPTLHGSRMRFESPTLKGRLLRRYKRFLADVVLEDGRQVTAHCANSGSMRSCCVPGGWVWLTREDNPKRRLLYTWQVAAVNGARVFVNPVLANRVAKEAIENGTIAELRGYDRLETEPRVNSHTRFDLLLRRGKRHCYVEVKSATLQLGEGRIAFPDAVTERGTKYLRELVARIDEGHRGVLLFCANRTDARSVEPADAIDPLYGRTLRWAVERGLEVLAYRARVSPTRVALETRIPVLLAESAVVAPHKPKAAKAQSRPIAGE